MIRISFGTPQVRNRAAGFGIASFVTLGTVSNAVTTVASYSAISIIRVFLSVCVALAVLFILLTQKSFSRQIITALSFATITLFGIAAAVMHSVSDISLNSLAVDATLIVAGISLMFSIRPSPWPEWLATYFVFYSLATLFLTLASGGIFFSTVPRFNFEYGSELIGREETYSLGVSYFYGLASIAAMLGASAATILRKKIFFYICCLVFLPICFMGGGRGEVVIALLVLSIIVLSCGAVQFLKTLSLISFFALVLALALGSVSTEFSGQLAVVERFRLLFEGDLSSRDLLLSDAVSLVLDNPACLVFGCGFGFFQDYYGYELGFHPHNSVVESIIVFGLPFTLLVLSLLLRGAYFYLRQRRSIDFFLAFLIYSALVSLKSNYLYSNWILIVSACYLIFLGVSSSSTRRLKA